MSWMFYFESGYSLAWKIKLDFFIIILGAPVTITFFLGTYYETVGGGGGIVLSIFFYTRVSSFDYSDIFFPSIIYWLDYSNPSAIYFFFSSNFSSEGFLLASSLALKLLAA
jgi:hypothetical protein